MMLTATIEGYAAIFGERDLSGDIIRRGAFSRMAARPATPVRMLYQHAADKPLGLWRDIHEDETGLYVRGDLLLGNSLAADIFSLLSGKALNGLSIGFRTLKSRRLKNGRELLAIDLWEISIVTFPMAPHARITNVGSPASLPDRLRRAAGTMSQQGV